MKQSKIIALMAVLVLVLAACTDVAEQPEPTPAPEPEPTEAPEPEATTTVPDEPGEPVDEDPLAAYGESIDADPALVAKALGPVEPSDEASWNIILASIARANQDLDQATIDKALECWAEAECDTGSGGPLVMGYADGGGKLNVWRGVTQMEAILQALTYPEIGTIVTTEALWEFDPAVHQGHFEFLLQYPVDFIIGYPDFPDMVFEQIRAAEAAGIPYIPFSAGWVGLPGVHDFALIPGDDYLTVVGEDLCALGTSFAEVLNEGVGEGTVGVLGGTPGNALSLGWQRCHFQALAPGVEPINPPADETTTAGDTFWLNDVALEVVSGWLSTTPNIAGFSYEYADGLYTALQAYDNLGIDFEEVSLTVALRTDEQTLFCDWVERDNPNYQIWYSAGGNFQSRTAVTAAMMHLLHDAPIPGEIVVPHVMRQVTAADCNPDRATPTVSGTSLVPDEVLRLMFGGG